MIIECVVNISEGRDEIVLAALSAAAAPALLDTHRDPHHHRSVFTLAGPVDVVVAASQALATVAVERLDLSEHRGVHPRLGLVDVVPFVPYQPEQLSQPGSGDLGDSADLATVTGLRDDFAHWMATTLGVPSFLYGPLPGGRTRTLPQVRRGAFADFAPDYGPGDPHPTAGATAVGARPVLIAYNVWVSSVDVARQVARLARGPLLRTLGLAVGERAQVSCNLIGPAHLGPAQAFDLVARSVAEVGGDVLGAELVGLLPGAVLNEIPRSRWAELGLSDGDTVEARLALRRP
ncbi:MAG TPA: hypothetical protein VHV57_05355 [Acidimicrobiales bacterium]|nr:hypothetical protein [Acidimicrobiales bacterium]